MGSVVVGVVAAVPPASADAPAGSGASAKKAAAQPVTSRPDAVSARLAAAAQGSRVEVSSLDTETDTTYANPDGSLTTESSDVPVRVARDGGWVPVDLDLRHTAAGWSPQASPVDVTFSDGPGRAAVLGTGARQLGLSWLTSLPAPTVTGPTATYALGGGVSFVLTATATGFEQSLVLAHAPAAVPSIRLPLDVASLTLAADGSGGYEFDNEAGQPVYEMPAPVMYGAAVDPATGQPAQS